MTATDKYNNHKSHHPPRITPKATQFIDYHPKPDISTLKAYLPQSITNKEVSFKLNCILNLNRKYKKEEEKHNLIRRI